MTPGSGRISVAAIIRVAEQMVGYLPEVPDHVRHPGGQPFPRAHIERDSTPAPVLYHYRPVASGAGRCRLARLMHRVWRCPWAPRLSPGYPRSSPSRHPGPSVQRHRRTAERQPLLRRDRLRSRTWSWHTLPAAKCQ